MQNNEMHESMIPKKKGQTERQLSLRILSPTHHESLDVKMKKHASQYVYYRIQRN